jgi:hypothetical protein
MQNIEDKFEQRWTIPLEQPFKCTLVAIKTLYRQ